MSKEIESLKRIETTFSMNKQGKESVYREYTNSIYLYYEDFDLVLKGLQRLEAIEKGKNTDIIDNYMAFKNDNTNPSEALECLEKLKGMEISSMPFSDEYGTQEVDLNDIRKVGSQLNTDFREYTATIKQALLKAQEQNSTNLLMQELDCKDFADLRKYARCGYEKINKQYLKWEDLEFKEVGQKQIIKVKKNDNLYILKYYISVFDEELIEILANDWTFITGLSNRKYDKQFFNDLHLEVEE